MNTQGTIAAFPDLGIDDARAVLQAQPLSQLLGAKIVEFSPTKTVLEFLVRNLHLQQHGTIHGGVISYLVDNALTFAAGAALGPLTMTSGFTIDYLRPAEGYILRAEASVVRAGARRAVCTCEIYGLTATREPTLCAIAQGSAMPIRRNH